MSKKLLIPLILLAVVCAAGLGIFIASNQSAQPTASDSDTAKQKTELTIAEIDRTITVPTDLGKTSYQLNGPDSILFYSDKYEKLVGCAGHHLGELKLSDTQTQGALLVGGTHPYATFVGQPMGQCSKDEGSRLADILLTTLTDAR